MSHLSLSHFYFGVSDAANMYLASPLIMTTLLDIANRQQMSYESLDSFMKRYLDG